MRTIVCSKIVVLIIVIANSFASLHASSIVEQQFAGTQMDSELIPLAEEFVRLSSRAGIELPLQRKILQIRIIPHDELLSTLEPGTTALALTILNENDSDSTILLSDRLRSSPQELRILLFHELLHAAGFDHPKVDCNWSQVGCGIMGRSPFQFLRLDRGHADFIVKQSFKPSYLAKLPRLGSGMDN